MAGSQGRDNWAAMHRGFGWQVPPGFNIAEACCGRWARREDADTRVAIVAHGASPAATLTFAQLQREANAMSRLLVGLGVHRGDRVAIVMPQRFETAIAYMAVLQLGAVAMPLSMLFGPEALEYRLQDSEAVVAICDESSIGNIGQVRASCPLLRSVVGVGGAAAQADLSWEAQRATLETGFTPAATHADDGAVLIYTSGTTGPPKGALIPHRALVGNLPGFVCSQNWFGFRPLRPRPGPPPAGEGASPESDAVFWSPADWAWTGGLMDALLPSLYFGRPIVACNARFNPDTAFTLMQEHGVTHTFLFPTALKAMMKAYPRPRDHFALRLQAVMSAGEAVGDAVFQYCREQLGVTVNEMFGQTEINYVVGNCSMNGDTAGGVGWPARPGSMGRPYPGHRVAVIDDDGNEVPPGVPGDVAVNRYDVHGEPDPIFFLGYWKNPEATRRKFTGDWCRTGDLATRDEDGYLWYQGRADDVFKAAGYRIGPSEIENCLVKHPAVINAAVVPKPDPERGALVKAYVVLAPNVLEARAITTRGPDAFDAELVSELQLHVKGKLAPYEYPKEIEFIDALPMTTTGKVQRRVLRLQEEERARGRVSS
ncbi:AMP-binding protein [Ramlibacter sp. USB13]|uniref:AMP-binding protein n=1 Tax=Ramlibacter cellulosilyticus TaxID=2764187 RepID=A0A923MRC8_9BURK|nr:AMP-binding protein [Ramlibacter cellulosilyticus]MBC5784412.1 AMP-binding protein [Ramlibacter cellulosilyticus]